MRESIIIRISKNDTYEHMNIMSLTEEGIVSD